MTRAKTAVAEITAIARRVRTTFVASGRRAKQICLPASDHLTAELCDAGFDARSVRGYVLPVRGDVLLHHHWTEAAGLLIDITIDQLGRLYPSVFIASVAESRDHPIGLIYSPIDEYHAAILCSRSMPPVEAVRAYRIRTMTTNG